MDVVPVSEPATSTLEEQPFVSVIVPVRNEAGFIGRCFEALALQDYPRDRFEVIVLDGGSTDTTVPELHEVAREHGLAFALLPNPRRTTASGFNLGLAAARGDVIIRVDGHTRVDPTFISASVAALQSSGADAVGGPIRTRGEGRIGRAIALAMASPFGVGNAAFRYSDEAAWTDTVPFGAYRREVFERVGELAEDIDRGEDDEFNYRLRDHGLRIFRTPSIGSDYYARGSFTALARQYWGYGIAKAAVLGRHPRRLSPRHLVPSAFVLSLASALLAPLDRRFLHLSGLAAGAYALASAIATLRIALRGHGDAAPYLPPVFATIHLTAGAGFLAGIVLNLFRRSGKRA
jgi:glycosyltransferase involved in cell wall biosynthesis